ncbi:peptide synthetase domain protein [Mycobacterium ulcerans str. Harvey]|uniref:Peptide synthetase domain protein n=1 Tax=Mycobacterium ulcerans str. Harvey TaxID=1299332 RepID=A0ABN0R3F1_MYCUL|nr:peptide synthetase domain protein [Mycobacterium ulcerans str. Harvey]
MSGLSDGTYHKLDEFLPQFLKGCIQLGAWPLLDTTWEMAPVDFTSKAIVHIAKRPQNLNQAYFVVHPRSRQVSDYIDWHREVGYDIRGLPWDVWKRELLGLGTEGLRKTRSSPSWTSSARSPRSRYSFRPPAARCLIPPQRIWTPTCPINWSCWPATRAILWHATTTTNCPATRVPAYPTSLRWCCTPGRIRQALDDRLRFDGVQLDFVETYYVLFNDPVRGLSFMARYVLHNGFLESDKLAEVWSTFRDRQRPGTELAIRQRYPLGHARLENSAKVRLEIGPSGYGEEKVWAAWIPRTG